MADVTSKSFASGGPAASRAEIDALGQIILATIAMAAQARSDAATALLERALAMLNDRFGIKAAGTLGAQGADGSDDDHRANFRPS